MPPEEVLWDYEEHTRAKHRILLRYLQAWLPIMASRNRRLNLIDGFAGPGRYKGGEAGSPLLMLDAYLSHRYRARMADLELFYDFIETDPRRVAHLRSFRASLVRLMRDEPRDLVWGTRNGAIVIAKEKLPPLRGSRTR